MCVLNLVMQAQLEYVRSLTYNKDNYKKIDWQEKIKLLRGGSRKEIVIPVGYAEAEKE